MKTTVVYSKELITQICKTTIILSDATMQNADLVMALCLKRAYLQEENSVINSACKKLNLISPSVIW